MMMKTLVALSAVTAMTAGGAALPAQATEVAEAPALNVEQTLGLSEQPFKVLSGTSFGYDADSLDASEATFIEFLEYSGFTSFLLEDIDSGKLIHAYEVAQQ